MAFFILGHCAAEAYETMEAIEPFKAALKYKPNDLDANMALLAEYSVAVYSKDIQPQAKWEAAYSKQLAYLIDNVGDDRRSTNRLITMFDEKALSESVGLTAEDKAYKRKYGLGILR